MKYRKTQKISLWAYTFQRPFWGAYFRGGRGGGVRAIFWGAYNCGKN